mmetsp:Transcript_66259/g.184516  ORF Transcript_66259/g.184516 Transcript_66259/m.184516 type:complete len:452 (-) Transcript_66259:225-1580(-)
MVRVDGGGITAQERCRWAAWRGDVVTEDESLIDLPHAEQVSRGQELLQMLKRNAASSKQAARSRRSSRPVASAGQVRVIVRRTFIELVVDSAQRPECAARRRALTDSELFGGLGSDKEAALEDSACWGKFSDYGDLSTASTDDPDEPFEVQSEHQQQHPQYNAEMHLEHQQQQAQSAVEAWWTLGVGGGYEGSGPMTMICPAPGEWHWSAPCLAMGHSGSDALPVGTMIFGSSFGNAYHSGDDLCAPYDGACVEGFAPDGRNEADGYAGDAGATALHGESMLAMNSSGHEDPSSCSSRTTVMLRNLPNGYSRSMLIDLINAEGFRGKYDFVYLPVDFSSQAGIGYAFVNFSSPIDAERCHAHFEGFKRWSLPSEKVCTVTWAGPHQGLSAHMERYRNSPVMHDSVPDEWKPVVFHAGARIPFPQPTQPIRKPKIRRRPDASQQRDSNSSDA